MSMYLIHSAKGTTWSNHKYIKKVGNKYIYKSTGLSAKELSNLEKGVKSGSLGTGDELRKNLGDNYGQVTSSIASKFKKPSSSGSSSKSKSKSSSSKGSDSSSSKKSSSSSSSKSSTSSTKSSTTSKSASSSKEETSTNKTSTTKESNTIQDLKTTINSIVDLGDNDSYVAVQNDDGSITVRVTYEDGTYQDIKLNNMNKVVSVGEKIKNEDEEINHSSLFWNNDNGFYHSNIRKGGYRCRH